VKPLDRQHPTDERLLELYFAEGSVHGEERGADRQHLHFRLLDLGLSQRKVVAIYYAYCLLLGAVALLVGSRLVKLGMLLGLGMLTLLFLAWLARRTSSRG